MLVVFTDLGWEDYIFWQKEDRKKLAKVNALIKDIERNGNGGLGLPEPLVGNLSGFWSRRIDAKNRLIYRISEEDGNRRLEIVQCRSHYRALL